MQTGFANERVTQSPRHPPTDDIKSIVFFSGPAMSAECVRRFTL
jgi:hypothetical protein